MRRVRPLLPALALSCALSACSGGGGPQAGAAQGIGDPYYPSDGNRGYDVSGYWVTTTYHPEDVSFSTTTLVRATATQSRRTFDLDLNDNLTVSSVVVNGKPARFSRMPPHEVVITPRDPLVAGRPLEAIVRDSGPVARAGNGDGWGGLISGGGVIAGEPHSCTYWYACNDHPSDKATFHLAATVPAAFTVISNGVEGATTSGGTGSAATRTFRWKLDVPATTYETTIAIDEFVVKRSTLPDGTPVVDAYSPGALPEQRRESRLPEILALLASKFGPYPAPAAGGIFVDRDLGLSLETYSRPVYSERVSLHTIVHENAHQWWGDNVSIAQWRDICLNECLASYSTWLWDEAHGVDLDARYRQTLFRVDFHAPLYDMGAGHEFDAPGVYTKGAYFVHALRRKIGNDGAFFGALQQIQKAFAGRNLSMLQFRDQLSRRTGIDLTSFWRQWVLGDNRPDQANLFPGSLWPGAGS
jgi:aminopeptidase N